MRKFKILPLLLLLLTMATSVAAQKKTQKTYIPWNNGKLVVSEEGRYLKHENGTPFFCVCAIQFTVKRLTLLKSVWAFL